jgi:hypothetical protein
MNARQIETEARNAGFFLMIGLTVVGGLLIAAGGGAEGVGAPMALVGVSALFARWRCR